MSKAEQDLIQEARSVVKKEIDALIHMKNNINIEIVNAVNAIYAAKGKVVVCGMGKSGIVGKKIAASLASTGTPAFSLHPGEAYHGDLGMIGPEDVFLAISNSGETEELVRLLPFLKNNNNLLISMAGSGNSTLALESDVYLNINVVEEVCPHQLAPTCSTTATMVMGDVLTVLLMNKRRFQPEEFARFHPGGALGRMLLSSVKDEMISVDLPVVAPSAGMQELISTITSKQMGVAILVDGNEVVGLVTDGDLRRALHKYAEQSFQKTALDIATVSPLSVTPEVPIKDAIEKMSRNNVSCLVVLKDGVLQGLLKRV